VVAGTRLPQARAGEPLLFLRERVRPRPLRST